MRPAVPILRAPSGILVNTYLRCAEIVGPILRIERCEHTVPVESAQNVTLTAEVHEPWDVDQLDVKVPTFF